MGKLAIALLVSVALLSGCECAAVRPRLARDQALGPRDHGDDGILERVEDVPHPLSRVRRNIVFRPLFVSRLWSASPRRASQRRKRDVAASEDYLLSLSRNPRNAILQPLFVWRQRKARRQNRQRGSRRRVGRDVSARELGRREVPFRPLFVTREREAESLRDEELLQRRRRAEPLVRVRRDVPFRPLFVTRELEAAKTRRKAVWLRSWLSEGLPDDTRPAIQEA